jgi:hypothetical protein
MGGRIIWRGGCCVLVMLLLGELCHTVDLEIMSICGG